MNQGHKVFTLGTHRTRSPSETHRLIQPYLRRAGITRVADITGLDIPNVPTVLVTRPNGRSLSVAQGKGITLEAAKVSGIMEAFEQFHAENVELPVRLARVGALVEAEGVVDLAALPRFPRVSGELVSETRMLWIEAEDLLGGSSKWVPYELVHLDMTLPLPEGTGHFPLSSNGLASGNDVTEATVHALCELIERDARTLFFLGDGLRSDALRLDLSTVEDSDCQRVIGRFQDKELRVAVWDVTSDIPVACFVCALLERDDNPFRRVPLALGSGCHLDRNVALLRALTEAAQTRLTNIAGSRDDTSAAALESARSAELQGQARELLNRASATRPMGSVPHSSTPSVGADLSMLLDALRGAHLTEFLRVDLSREGWPISVVRVIVPGLEFLIDMPGYQPSERGLRALQARACES
jgi:YcaO-like protein with predicted kinase domain